MDNNVQSNATSDAGVSLTGDDAADAILAKWADAAEQEQPSENNSEEATEAIQEEEETTQDELPFDEDEDQDPDTEEDEELEEASDDASDDDEDQTEDEQDVDSDIDVSDETEVEFVVAGETHTSTIGQLKRLAGQEKALTQKSQELARQRKEADDVTARSHVVLQKLVQDAEERAKPYAEIDMLVASKTMDATDFAQLRKEAQEAEGNLKFLKEEADAFYGELKQKQSAAQQEQAREAVKVLQEAIPEWSNALYNDIRQYAIAQGLAEAQVNTITDPTVIQLINKARLFEQGKRVATVKKKQQSKKKALRSKKAPPNAEARRQAKKQKAVAGLGKARDLDDIADIILQGWEQ